MSAVSLLVSMVARVTFIRMKRTVSVTRTAQDDTVNEQCHRMPVMHGLAMLTARVSPRATASNAYVHLNERVDCAKDSLAVIHVLLRRAWTMLIASPLATTLISTAIVVTIEQDVSANRKYFTILANLELARTVVHASLQQTALFAYAHQTQRDITANSIEPSIFARTLHAWTVVHVDRWNKPRSNVSVPQTQSDVIVSKNCILLTYAAIDLVEMVELVYLAMAHSNVNVQRERRVVCAMLISRQPIRAVLRHAWTMVIAIEMGIATFVFAWMASVVWIVKRLRRIPVRMILSRLFSLIVDVFQDAHWTVRLVIVYATRMLQFHSSARAMELFIWIAVLRIKEAFFQTSLLCSWNRRRKTPSIRMMFIQASLSYLLLCRRSQNSCVMTGRDGLKEKKTRQIVQHTCSSLFYQQNIHPSAAVASA
jgi:hypothetical protein